MVSLIASAVNSCVDLLSHVYTPIPEKVSSDQKIFGDWCNISVFKRDIHGEYLKSPSNVPLKFNYTQEISTGDLYGIPSELDQSPLIALKAFGMFCVTSLYIVGIMAANLVKIAVDITSIFWKVIPQFIDDLYAKGFSSALGNSFITVGWEIPTEIMLDIWRICRSPVYAIGIKVACLWTIISPCEGRKWLGKIETALHDGLSYKMDWRCGKHVGTPLDLENLKKGKIHFLGYCMIKRGNIRDRLDSINKYEIVNQSA